LHYARRFLIPFPDAAGPQFDLEDTVYAIPCPEKLFQPARRKLTLPRSVSLYSCAAGIAIAFLTGTAAGRLSSPQSGFAAGMPSVGPPSAAAQVPQSLLPAVDQPMPAGIASTSPAASTPALRRIRFTLNQSRSFQRVGGLQLRLKKADAKRQTFTLTLQMKDKRVELQDRTLAEPIRVHPAGARESEILIHRIEGNHIEGVMRMGSTL